LTFCWAFSLQDEGKLFVTVYGVQSPPRRGAEAPRQLPRVFPHGSNSSSRSGSGKSLRGGPESCERLCRFSQGERKGAMGETVSEKALDLRGWSCPWCILKAKSRLRTMKPGQTLELLCTDLSIQKNLPSVLKGTGDRIVQWEQHADYVNVVIRRGCDKTGS